VILVDDDPAALRALRRALQGEPCEVLTTTRPGQVLEWLREGEVRLVISDQRMPEMAGHELLQSVLERSSGTACVLLTAWPDAPEAAWLLGRGIRSVLAKPWNVQDLRRLVRGCL
jgi:DNA-binding NtrC family response regulator